jgi:hypothetical protein
MPDVFVNRFDLFNGDDRPFAWLLFPESLLFFLWSRFSSRLMWSFRFSYYWLGNFFRFWTIALDFSRHRDVHKCLLFCGHKTPFLDYRLSFNRLALF